MAGKTIISDFSALKGKVSFSDKTNAIRKPSKDTPAVASECTESDKSLRIGCSVVLMDSNLRGIIVGLGKTVRIELEDGLVIESAYGEFAVTDKAEITSLKEAKIKAKKDVRTSCHAKPSVNTDGSLTVDLHIETIPGGMSVPKGQQLQFQLETFRKVIRENISHKGRKITFIHGIGDGILKAAIRKELDEVFALRCSYNVGDPAVTVVSIR